MRIKKYRARDMKEALVQIKQDFGADAVILHSRNVVVGGVMGFFGKEMVEVTAGVEINLLEDALAKRKEYFNVDSNVPAVFKTQSVATKVSRQPHQAVQVCSAEPAKPVLVAPDVQYDKLVVRMDRFEEQISSMSSQMTVILNNVKSLSMKNANGRLLSVFEYLTNCGLKESVARDIVDKLEQEMMGKDLMDAEKVKRFVEAELLSIVATNGPIELKKDAQQIIAFIGSTGVGKTTTIAKLAANFALMQKKNVALITIDTYRIAAIEQLKTYASIIGVPIDVVFTPEEFKQVLASHKDKDLILIDTAGRSPKNAQQMKELKKFLDAGGTDIEKYLVLSVTSKNEDVEDTVKRFDIIRSKQVIFTKLDETSSYGVIVNVLYKTDKKVAYITTGQNVPDDLEVAVDRELVRKVMGQAELVL